jgi:hypothetical protein
VKAETADYLAKARATLADAQQIATLPLPHVAAREAYYAPFHAAEAYIFEHTGKVASAGGRFPGSARHSGYRCHHDRSPPPVPLLRRSHDHRRDLRARRRSPRPSTVRRPRQNRYAMTLAASSLHHPLAGTARSRHRATVIPATASSDPTPPTVPKLTCRAQHQRPILDCPPQSALNDVGQNIPRPSRCPIKSP